MLKAFPNTITGGGLSAKCGEIYCQSSKDFTILCTFCEMKTFEFEDFLLHFKNIHFENNLLKTEEVDIQCTPFLDVSVKCEPSMDVGQQLSDLEHDMDDDMGDVVESENVLTIWHKSKNEPRSSDEEEDRDDKDGNWSDTADPDLLGNDDDDDNYKPARKRGKKLAYTASEQTEHKCETCQKNYKNAATLKAHVKTQHTEGGKPIREIICPVCAMTLPSLRRLDEHCLDAHGGMPCPHCDKKYKNRTDLKIHMPMHTGIKSCVCDFENCGKSFYNRKSLRNHQMSHKNFKKYICETCGYSCRVKETLRVHNRMHTGEKPYSCQLCDKRFASASLLSEHRASHQSTRPHICDVCGASFGRQKSLYHHKHLHLGIKKFKCKVCGNAYAQAAGLAGHMRKHREEGMC